MSYASALLMGFYVTGICFCVYLNTYVSYAGMGVIACFALVHANDISKRLI